MLVFYDWPFPHVYFAKNVVYFPFNCWLSFSDCVVFMGILLKRRTNFVITRCHGGSDGINARQTKSGRVWLPWPRISRPTVDAALYADADAGFQRSALLFRGSDTTPSVHLSLLSAEMIS